jgi:hypothetical protein
MAKTVHFPRGTITCIKQRGRLYLSHSELIEAFDGWIAILVAAEAPGDALEAARVFRNMIADVHG